MSYRPLAPSQNAQHWSVHLTAAEDHGGMLMRPLRCLQLINSNRGLINIPAVSSHAQLLMKISTDKSIIMGHF